METNHEWEEDFDYGHLKSFISSIRQQAYEEGRKDENLWFKSGDGVQYLQEKHIQQGRQAVIAEILDEFPKRIELGGQAPVPHIKDAVLGDPDQILGYNVALSAIRELIEKKRV